jgi:hypothetical protein
LDLPQALQTSQLAELGRFGGGSNELRIYGNGVVMLHVPATVAPLFFIYFCPLLPLLSSSSFVFLVFKLLLEKTQ